MGLRSLLLFALFPFYYPLLMRGSKLTNRCVYFSNDGKKLIFTDSPLHIQMIERNLLLKGKMIRRKKPFKSHTQHNRVQSLNSITSSSPTKDKYTEDNFIKKESLNIESKLCTYDILNYLQMKCSEVFFRTQNNFSNFQTSEPPSTYSGKVGVSLKRIPTSDSRSRLSNVSAKNICSLQNKSTEVANIHQQLKEITDPSTLSQSQSPVKVKSGRKSYVAPVSPIKPPKGDSKLRTLDQTKSKKLVNKDKPLLTYNHIQLRHVKSQSYAMMEAQSEQLIVVNRGKISLEIASLTKIMTAYLILTLAQKRNIDLKTEKVEVQKYVERITGTSADLIHGDIYTIHQLMHGLLLPSGNDAALVLADWGGSLLNQQVDKSTDYRENISLFVQEMTKTAKDLGLKDTKYGNPHGLPHSQGKSTALDQCKLAAICLRNPIFTHIVRMKEYKFQITNSDGKKRLVYWQNTNKLLRRKGFIGLKTGITVTAGPCLISAYQFKQKIYILTVLRANKVSRRFKDSRKILHWALSKLYQGTTYFQQSLQLQQLNKNKKQLDSDYSEDENQFVYGEEGTEEYCKRKSIITNEL